MTDNGPQQDRYNAGMRGRKGGVYEGGIRVPFFLRWPGLKKEPKKVGGVSAHIDVVPTLLEACRVEKPKDLKLDGRSLLPALDSGAVAGDRTIFLQWHRGDVPELHRACTAIGPRWKLVRQTPAGKPELYDLLADPAEKSDVAAEHPDEVARLTKEYETWFEDMRKTREFAPPRIVLDPAHEDPVLLTRQDWRGTKAGWGRENNGHWLVEAPKAAKVEVTLHFRSPGGPADLIFECGMSAGAKVRDGTTKMTLPKPLELPQGRHQLHAYLREGPKVYGVDYVELKRAD
jgi:hypothetical protein